MINEQLLDFIRSQQKLGTDKEAITNMLLGQDWTQADINEAFATIGNTPSSMANASVTPMSESPLTINPLPSVAPSQYSSPPSSQVGSKRKGFWLKTVLVFLFVVAVLIGGAYCVLAFILKPQDVVSNAIKNVGNADKMHTEVTVSFESADKKTSQASLNIKADADNSDLANKKFATVVSLEYPMFTGSFEFRLIDKVLFGRLITFPSYLKSYESSVGHGWYSLSLDSLEETASNKFMASSSLLTAGNASALKGEVPNFSDIYDKLMKSGVVSSLTFSGISNSSSGLVRNYVMKIDKDVLIDKVKNVEGIKGNPYASMGESMIGSVSISPIVISTSLVSGSLRSISFDVQSDQPASVMRVSVVYDDSMEDISIEKPAEVKVMDKILSEYLESMKSKITLSPLP